MSSSSRASSNRVNTNINVSADEIARLRSGSRVPGKSRRQGLVTSRVTMRESNERYRAEHDVIARKVFLSIAILVVLLCFSLCIMGAQGQYYPYSGAYEIYTPAEVFHALTERAYNCIAEITHLYSAHTKAYIMENVPGYWAVARRAGVLGITLISSVLLSVSGMLFQNVFRNPIAGPGMLGVSSGVNLGMMLLVALYGAAAVSHIEIRYALCYGFGAAILVFVIIVGKKLSGKGKPFDTVTMLLVGSLLSQLLGFIVSFVTLYVMDEEDYLTFYTISQMLTVDTSLISWIALGIASALSLLPIIARRYKLTCLAIDEQESRVLGLDPANLKAMCLICGSIMILAAQIHVGMVSLISLIVPFLSRTWFGCEFDKQLIGNFCIGTVLLIICRDITDLIPFVVDGLAIGSIVSVVALPLVVVVMAKYLSDDSSY